MKFMVILKATSESEAGTMPSMEEIEASTKFNEELGKSRALLAAEGIMPTSYGVRIRFDPSGAIVTDGPFAEANEQVGGYWIIQAKSREDVVELFKRAPFRRSQTVEIRPFIQFEDMGELATPELVERWNTL